MYIRSLIFHAYLVIWTTFICSLFYPTTFFRGRSVLWVGKVWSKGLTKALKVICNIDHKIEGLENLPEGPCIVASKHQSAWETILYLDLLQSPVFIVKKELSRVPLYGRFLRTMRMVAVDRSAGSKALKLMLEGTKKVLHEGRPYVIFPEGTRTAIGASPKYQPGVAFLYMDKDINLPVIPVALNSGKFWPKTRILKTPGTITIKFLPAIEKGLGRKEFMSKLEKAIETESNNLL